MDEWRNDDTSTKGGKLGRKNHVEVEQTRYCNGSTVTVDAARDMRGESQYRITEWTRCRSGRVNMAAAIHEGNARRANRGYDEKCTYNRIL